MISFLFVAWLGLCCQQTQPFKPTASTALPRAQVILKDAYGGLHAVNSEVAATRSTRAAGLMYRNRLLEGEGMLFIFFHEDLQSFWMKNTLIPLDMIFINQQRRVVGIVARAEPETLISRRVSAPSNYVLEVPGGWSEKMGVQVGASVTFSGIDALNIEL